MCVVNARVTKWTTGASVRLSIDGEPIGHFRISPFPLGSSATQFECADGQHSYKFFINWDQIPGVWICSGTFAVAKGATRFGPTILINLNNGSIACALTPY
jgi:hypothetical protein